MALIIVTSRFPCGPGEEFILPESRYWSQLSSPYYLVPLRLGDLNTTSHHSTLYFFARYRHFLAIFFSFLLPLSPFLYIELFYLYKKHILNFHTIKSLLRSLSFFNAAVIYLLFFSILKPGHHSVYSYWNTEFSYAACFLKRLGIYKSVASRAHGFDFYQERHHSNYIPLKRLFLNYLDQFHVLSESSLNYAVHNYNIIQQKIHISPLGVNIPSHIPSKSTDTFNLLSISSCIPLKRVDKIAYCIYLFAIANPELYINWSHIGSGPLFDSLIVLCNSLFSSLDNCSFHFSGYLSRPKLSYFLDHNYFDCVINLSTSEGLPVSLLEAMAYGIPFIAPDIGNISVLTLSGSGYLLSSDPSDVEVLATLNHASSWLSHEDRLRTSNFIADHYNNLTLNESFISTLNHIL